MDWLPFLKVFIEFFWLVFIVYRIFLYFQANRNWLSLSALILIIVLYLAEVPGFLMGTPRGILIYHYALLGAGLLLTFESEIQAALVKYQKRNPEKKFFEKNGPLDEIVKACVTLASTKTGALMAIRRNNDLLPFIEKSVVIDARIRHELLLTIFMPPTYLHDGGVILSYERIISCSAIFPLTQSVQMKKKMGTRHRAAIGMSEETDALCLVVSEETGTISITDRGKLYYDLKPEELRPAIEQALRFKKIKAHAAGQPDQAAVGGLKRSTAG